MPRNLPFTLMLLAVPLALAATVYKWVDENGVVHYSDQPHPSAQKLHVEPAQTYRAGSMPAPVASSDSSAPDRTGPVYQSCSIVEPGNEQAYSNISSLTVVVHVDPALRPGDQVFISMDGQALNNGAPTGPSFTISPVDRGSHTLQALVRDGSGGLLCQGGAVTVHVQQASVLNPANPQHASPPPPPPRPR